MNLTTAATTMSLAIQAAKAGGTVLSQNVKNIAGQVLSRGTEYLPSTPSRPQNVQDLYQTVKNFGQRAPFQVGTPSVQSNEPLSTTMEASPQELKHLKQTIQDYSDQQAVFSFFLLTLSIALVIDGSNRYALEENLKQEAQALKETVNDNPQIQAQIDFLTKTAASQGKMAALWMFLSGAALMTTAYYSGEMLYTIPQGVLTTTSARTLAARMIPSGPINTALRHLEIPLMSLAATSIVAVPAMYAQNLTDVMVPAGLGLFGVAFGMNLSEGGWRDMVFRPAMILAGSLMTIGAFKDVAFEVMFASQINIPALLLFVASMGLNGYLTYNEIPHFRKWYQEI